jgi:hypothetical protein
MSNRRERRAVSAHGVWKEGKDEGNTRCARGQGNRPGTDDSTIDIRDSSGLGSSLRVLLRVISVVRGPSDPVCQSLRQTLDLDDLTAAASHRDPNHSVALLFELDGRFAARVGVGRVSVRARGGMSWSRRMVGRRKNFWDERLLDLGQAVRGQRYEWSFHEPRILSMTVTRRLVSS